MLFKSRRQAGKLLTKELQRRKIRPDVVFGLARGGMVVAAEVAKILGVELRPLIVRKIGTPENPEFAVGAVAEIPKWEVYETSQTSRPGIVVWWDEKVLRQIHVSEEWKKKRVEEKEMEVLKYRNELQFSSHSNHSNHSNHFDHCLIVDDGAATGISMMAALSAAKTPLSGVAAIKTIVALPVASTEAADMLWQAADQVVILHKDPYLEAVGVYYRQFKQVSWEKVKQLLESSYGTNKKIN